MSSDKPVLLVLRHHGLGDLVTAQPALRALRRRFQGYFLVTTCPSWLLSLAQVLGTADELISETLGTPDVPSNFGPCDHRRADPVVLGNVFSRFAAVDTMISMRTPGLELVPILKKALPTTFVSYRHASIPETHGFPELNFDDHILERWRKLLRFVGAELHDNDLYCSQNRGNIRAGHTVVHVGAGSPARTWPQERWVEIVKFLVRSDHFVVLTGSSAESDIVSKIEFEAGLGDEQHRLLGRDIMELVDIVAGARLVLSTDTGVSHLATMFRRPAITLFSAVSPACWGPPAGNPQHRSLWTGRTGDPYAEQIDAGLLEISVSRVINEIQQLESQQLSGKNAP